jgi:hypothetical protein
MQCRCVPATSAMHVNLRAEGTLLYYIRSLEVIVVYLTPRHAQPWSRPGAGPNRHLVRLEHYIAYYVEQNVWGPNDTLESDTARTSTLRLQLRTWVPHAPGKWGVSALRRTSRESGKHALTINAAPCHTPFESTLSYRSRGPHKNSKYESISLFLRFRAWW